MADVFVERTYEPPLTRNDVFAAAESAGGCFSLYKIEWVESLLAADGTRMICHFRAPDVESVRMALRATDGPVPNLWPGTEHIGDASVNANIVVQRRFDSPASLEALQAREDDHAWCLEARRVRFARTFFSTDGLDMVCLYEAPDAESVRQAQRQAGMPVARAWAFQHLHR